jgi:hypothetical protein
VEFEHLRFKLVWRTIGSRRRATVGVLAFLGRRSPDPETAWLMCMFALAQLRWQWLRFAAGAGFLAVAVWGLVLTHRFPVQFVLQFFAGILLLASLWTYRRTVRVNEPTAEAPGRK